MIYMILIPIYSLLALITLSIIVLGCGTGFCESGSCMENSEHFIVQSSISSLLKSSVKIMVIFYD